MYKDFINFRLCIINLEIFIPNAIYSMKSTTKEYLSSTKYKLFVNKPIRQDTF